MNQPVKPASRGKVFLAWAFVLGNLLFWVGFWFWYQLRHVSGENSDARSGDPESQIGFLIFMVLVGMFFLTAGLIAYGVVVWTTCFTFNFERPIWSELKVKVYFANIFVPLAVMLGCGFLLAAIASPVLTAAGLPSGVSNMGPFFAVILIGQVILIWVQVWAPVERRGIIKRLTAQGLTPSQLNEGALIGISDPARSSFKKFGAIEEDIGMIWLSPDRIVFCGDSEQFAITRDTLMEIERKADSGSVTMLSGVSHVVLHVRLPDGNVRQVRLHTEGNWTLGTKRRAMDELANLVTAWQSSGETTVDRESATAG